jgi:hypothetical protein
VKPSKNNRFKRWQSRLPTQLSIAEQKLFEHLRRHRLTVKWIWSHVPTLAEFTAIELAAAMRLLTRRGLVAAFPLHHGRFYFTFARGAAERLGEPDLLSGEFSELAKIRAYTKLIYFVIHRPNYRELASDGLRQTLANDAIGLPGGFYTTSADSSFLGFLRVDTVLHGSPVRMAQTLRDDILRLAKLTAIVQRIKAGQFELSMATATQYRAEAIVEHFRTFPYVGSSPINIAIIPELVSLVTSIPLGQVSRRINL